ncbi:polyprenol phosphomannose-dependent alpha 1,6 mannosyltransferase MptB, partial [Corynebacterium frankenforstense]|uniref:polyprenol phosphomannose-dependent alpha 1,6 mannosyltransferase MptB n=1 Tax=Corynebacterium frankenforstense TaxID=1230998 RepID=UPI0026EBE2BD
MDRLPSPLVLGTVATVLIATSSFGAGAIRNRGGVLDALGLNVLAYGHAAGVCGSILWLGIFLLVAAWILAGRRTVFAAGAATDVAGGDARDVGNLTRTFLGPLADDRRLGAVVRGTTAWTLPLLLAAPILSRDVYSYLMQGAMLRDGFDPYTQGAAANPGPMLLEVSHDWRNTTTPYGPLHLWLGEGITRLVGDHVTAGVVLYKLVSVAGMAAILWAVPRIAARLGADPALATWLGVANPVLVLHMVGGMHNESLMVGLVSLGLVAALDRRFVAGVAIIAVAVSLKATAAIALPFVVWLATRHLGTRLTRRADGA